MKVHGPFAVLRVSDSREVILMAEVGRFVIFELAARLLEVFLDEVVENSQVYLAVWPCVVQKRLPCG